MPGPEKDSNRPRKQDPDLDPNKIGSDTQYLLKIRSEKIIVSVVFIP